MLDAYEPPGAGTVTAASVIAATDALLAQPGKPTVPDVLPICNDYYRIDGNWVGGSLHIVLEDSNVDDGSVEWCLEHAREIGDEAGERLAMVLLRCSKTQRAKLSARID